MATFGNWTPTLPLDTALDVLLVYTDTGLFAPSKGGGAKFDPGKQWASIEFDGMRTQVMQTERVVGYQSTIKGKFISCAIAAIGALEHGSTVSSATITPIAADLLLTSGQYLKNIRAICKLGDNTFLQVRFIDGARVDYNLGGADKKEVEVDVTFHARLDMTRAGAALTDCPYVVEYLSAI